MLSISLWGGYFIQIQSKLCDSEGKVKRKVTANCTQCSRYLKFLRRFDRDMKALEYILDSENQKRHRQDKAIKKAWGYAFYMKGLIYDVLGYYQPTLMVYHFNGNRKEVNPTWTKRSRLVWEACQNAKKITVDGEHTKSSFGGKKQMEKIDKETLKEELPKKSKVSTSLKSWDNCTHSKKKETKIITDFSDNSIYEICYVCNISRRVYPVHPNNLKTNKGENKQ